jgi:DNA-binding response OmpR family regulator
MPEVTPTVLVVEEEPAIRSMLELALGRSGFGVVLARTGEEAVAVFRRGGIDLVLLDVQMPGLHGVETARAIRAIDPATKCFFMTGNPGRYTAADFAAVGAARVFAKPFTVSEVVEALRREVSPGGTDAAG